MKKINIFGAVSCKRVRTQLNFDLDLRRRKTKKPFTKLSANGFLGFKSYIIWLCVDIFLCLGRGNILYITSNNNEAKTKKKHDLDESRIEFDLWCYNRATS